MTTDDVRRMEAGRELDALVAERLFQWRWYTRHAAPGRFFGPPEALGTDADAYGPIILYDPVSEEKEPEWEWWLHYKPPGRDLWVVPNYSDDPTGAAALLVVDRMIALGAKDDFGTAFSLRYSTDGWYASFSVPYPGEDRPNREGYVRMQASRSLAICRAALLTTIEEPRR